VFLNTSTPVTLTHHSICIQRAIAVYDVPISPQNPFFCEVMPHLIGQIALVHIGHFAGFFTHSQNYLPVILTVG
jgi:hypothetical protein